MRKRIWAALLMCAGLLATAPGRSDSTADLRLGAASHSHITNPVTDLVEVELLSKAIKNVTHEDFCKALKDHDYAAIRSLFAPAATVAPFETGARTVLLQTPQLKASLWKPSPECCGSRDDFARSLETLTSDWRTVERCEAKPFQIFATRTSPRHMEADLDFSFGGVTNTGARVGDSGDIHAEFDPDEDRGWKISALEFKDRQRTESPRPAYADRTKEANLPLDWTDEGYEKPDINLGQVLYGGVAVGDFDKDGWPDIYVSHPGGGRLYRNLGAARFEDVTEKAGLVTTGNTQSAVIADFDNDGYPDLFIVNAAYSLVKTKPQGNLLFRNMGNGTFQKVSGDWGPIGPASGVTVADYDNDGLLDIYITYYQDENLHKFHHRIEARDGFGNRLLHNLGGFRFEDATEKAGAGGGGWSYASAWADYDGDGLIDLYVANDFGDSYLYKNQGNGTFRDVAVEAGAANPANGMSADWGDFDNDGRLDMYVSNMYTHSGRMFLPLYTRLQGAVRQKLEFSVLGNALYRQDGSGHFQECGRSLGAAVAGWAWGANFLDWNNDGWLDVHVANGYWAGESTADA